MVTAVGILLVALAGAERKPHPAPAEPAPATRVDVAPLGYMPPGAFYLTYRLSSAAMGFFDDDHLLFTFRVGGLLKRMPSDRLDDEDQEIRAVVLDLRSGKVMKQTEWRMHDRTNYLWPYADGRFLVRIRNSLFLTDESLRLRPFLTLNTDLEEVQVSPDRKLTVLETDEPQKARADIGDTRGLGAGKPVKVVILRSGTETVLAESSAQGAVRIPVMGDGLLDTIEGRKAGWWLVRRVPFGGEAQNVAEVQSPCRPTAEPVSTSVALIVGCYLQGDDHLVSALSMDGRELWRTRWENKYVWGWFTTAENGSRFAYESLEVNRPISTFDALYPEDVRTQMVGVYDTETGKLVLVRDASPVLSAGQNAALSRDGTRFAVLREGAIEVYDLPPVEKPATGNGQ